MAADSAPQHQGAENVVQVSAKKNARFYTDLAKKFMETHAQIELVGLGNGMLSATTFTLIPSLNFAYRNVLLFIAINTVVTVAEMLKAEKLGTTVSITTDLVDARSEGKEVPKMTIVFKQSPGNKQ
jgi:hypothetical protein